MRIQEILEGTIINIPTVANADNLLHEFENSSFYPPPFMVRDRMNWEEEREQWRETWIAHVHAFLKSKRFSRDSVASLGEIMWEMTY